MLHGTAKVIAKGKEKPTEMLGKGNQCLIWLISPANMYKAPEI